MSEKIEQAITATIQLEELSESEWERLWLDEAEHRLKELYEGQVKAVPADEVFYRASSEFS